MEEEGSNCLPILGFLRDPPREGKKIQVLFYKEIPYIFVKGKKKEFMGHYGELGWLEDLVKTMLKAK